MVRLHLPRRLGEAASHFLAEQGHALTAKLGSGALGFGRDADGRTFSLRFLRLADQQRVAFVRGSSLEVVGCHHLGHRGGDRLIEGDVVQLQVDEVIAPRLQRDIEVLLHLFHDLAAQAEDFSLLHRGDEATGTALHAAHHGREEVLLADELEGHVLDRALVFGDDAVDHHRCEVDVCLVLGDGLELQLHGAVLDTDPAENLLRKRDEEVQAGAPNRVELAEDRGHGDGALGDRLDRRQDQEDHDDDDHDPRDGRPADCR